MRPPECVECQAISREFREVLRLGHEGQPGRGYSIEELITWFDQRPDDVDRRWRIRSALNGVMQRMRQHQKHTGHLALRPSIPPGGLTNPN